jgi:hypothetical protein
MFTEGVLAINLFLTRSAKQNPGPAVERIARNIGEPSQNGNLAENSPSSEVTGVALSVPIDVEAIQMRWTKS